MKYETYPSTGQPEQGFMGAPYSGESIDFPASYAVAENLREPSREQFSPKDQEKLSKIDTVEASLNALSTRLAEASTYNYGVTQSALRIAGQTVENNDKRYNDGGLIIQHNALVAPNVPEGGRATVYNSMVNSAYRALDGDSGGAPYWQDGVRGVPGRTTALSTELSHSVEQVSAAPIDVLARERVESDEGKPVSAQTILENIQKKVDEVISRTNSDAPNNLGQSLRGWSTTFLNDPNSIVDGRAKQKVLAINASANNAAEWGGELAECYDEIADLMGNMDILIASAKAKIYHNNSDKSSGAFRRIVRDPYVRQ